MYALNDGYGENGSKTHERRAKGEKLGNGKNFIFFRKICEKCKSTPVYLDKRYGKVYNM